MEVVKAVMSGVGIVQADNCVSTTRGGINVPMVVHLVVGRGCVKAVAVVDKRAIIIMANHSSRRGEERNNVVGVFIMVVLVLVGDITNANRNKALRKLLEVNL